MEIIVYGTVWCPDCWRSKRLLNHHEVPYTGVDIDKDKAGAEYVRKSNRGKQVVPTIVFSDNSTLAEPDNAILAEKLGVDR